MGSGALGLALVVAHSGIIAFSFLRLTVALPASHSVHLLISLCIQTPVTSYEDLGRCIWTTWKGGGGKHHSNSEHFGAMSSSLLIIKTASCCYFRIFIWRLWWAWYLDGDTPMIICVKWCSLLHLLLKQAFLATQGVSHFSLC